MSLKKLLELQDKIAEISEPERKDKPCSMFIRGHKTQAEELQRFKDEGRLPPDATYDDVLWIIILLVKPAIRDEAGNIIDVARYVDTGEPCVAPPTK
jgi:hypothetical protein